MGKRYIHEGYESLSKGTPGDGGQNLYVSKKGVLQRIFNFDTTGNGCFDIMITNSHEYNEKPRLHVLTDPAGTPRLREVLTDGCHAAAAADLNGDGYDDLVIGSRNNGHLSDLAAFVYYGGPDGITENRKIELSAPGCLGVACGDFNGDGLCDIAFIIEGGRLRVYTQTDIGYLRDGYVDFELDLTHIAAGDVDGDGYCDLYARVRGGEWSVLWGGPKGVDPSRRSAVGPATDDKVFDTLPFGGGNLRYDEEARPKLLTVDGRTLLLYCAAEEAVIFEAGPYRSFCPAYRIPLPGVISGAAGDVDGDGHDDLVLVCRPAGGAEEAVVVYGGERAFSLDGALRLPVKTPRDVVICDFSGNGCGDIAVCQGRTDVSYTSESLLFLSGKDGVNPEPRRFVTHNAVGAIAARTTGDKPQLLFVNQQQSDFYGQVPAYVYTGDKDGWSPDRRVELPGHSPGSILPADFFDTGFADILLLNNGEDQPEKDPKSYIYRGGPGGIDPENRVTVPTYLTWGGQVADVDKDGYLDIVFTSCNQRDTLNKNTITTLYGGPEGYSLDNSHTVEVAPDGELIGMMWPCLADLNGDGWLDLVVPVSLRSWSLVFWGGPEGYSLDRCQKLPIERALTVRAADLTGNGYLDLVFGTRASVLRNKGHEGSVVIFWGGPEGYSAARCCELPSYQCNNITISDLNHDGGLDIFVSSYFNSRERDVNSFIYWNDKGSFSVTNRKRIFSHSSSASLACDLDEDGYTDLIVANHRTYGSHRTDAAIWWNGPEGFSEERRSFLPCLGPHDMVSVDVGNIRDRGPEEHYTSPVVELTSGERVSRIGWEGELPRKTWVRARLRSADSLEALQSLPFAGPDGTEGSSYENGEHIAGQPGRYVQYRLYLGAINGIGTPRITSVWLEA